MKTHEAQLVGTRLKCSKAKSGGNWCRALDAMLAAECNDWHRGLSTLVLTSLKAGKSRCVGVVSRADSRDRGVMLNVCPFCEARIDWHIADKRKPSTQPAGKGAPQDGVSPLGSAPGEGGK